jgi:hypothetical protein
VGADGLRGSELQQMALAAAFLDELEDAFAEAFELVGLPRQSPEIRLRTGSLVADIQKGGAAAVGLVLIADALTGGATLPVTLPVYAKYALGGALVTPGTIGFVTDQVGKWSIMFPARRKLLAEAAQAEANIAVLREEAVKRRSEAISQLAQAAKLMAEAAASGAKAGPEVARTEAEARKQTVEASAIDDKKEAEIARLRAEARKAAAEADNLEAQAAATRLKTAEGRPAILADVASLPVRDGIDGQPASAPASAMISPDALRSAASRHETGAPIVALAANVGIPYLAQARAAGMVISVSRGGAPDPTTRADGGTADMIAGLTSELRELKEELARQRPAQDQGGAGGGEGDPESRRATAPPVAGREPPRKR